MNDGLEDYDITSSWFLNHFTFKDSPLLALGVGGHQCSTQLVLHLQNILSAYFKEKHCHTSSQENLSSLSCEQ